MTDGSGRNTAIIVAFITVFGSILTAVVANWDKIGPYLASNGNGGNGGVPASPPPTATPTTRPTPRPTVRPTPGPNFNNISRNSYRIGTVTIKNVRLNPMPPAVLTQHQEVTARFSYDVCCNATVRIWVRPVWTGSQCSYGASGSPKYTGKGSSSATFNMRGTGCSSARISGLRFSVKKEGSTSQDQTVIPILYTIQ